MITMAELVKNRDYREFLETKPVTPKISRDQKRMTSPPWVVYVQRDMDGPWGKKEFWKYGEAFRFFRAWMKRGCHDATINNKRVPFEPPMRLARIRGKYVTGSDGVRRQATKRVPWAVPASLLEGQPQHHWCMYCRRPTVFKFYSRHKRMGTVDGSTPRCCICGASARIALHHTDRLFRVH